MDIKFIFWTIMLWWTFFLVTSEPTEDKEALLKFINNINHSSPLNWEPNTSPCSNWTGVTCNHDKSRIIALRLADIGLNGTIPTNTLTHLPAIQILNLRSNLISGPFPSDIFNLANLTYLYLQFNNFTGSLPSNFSNWKRLSVLDLSNNGFNSSIPSSFSNLTQLVALNLANNSLSGEIPDISLPNLRLLDLSNNNLTGFIPQSLKKFPHYTFLGNNLSSEISPSPSPSPSPTPFPSPVIHQPKKKSTKINQHIILAIVISACVVAVLILVFLLHKCYSKWANGDGGLNRSETKEKPLQKVVSSGIENESSSLIFFEGRDLAFDLEDLLRASAEVLGKGTFGTTYKAALEDSTTVVVKRLKELNIGRREFEQQMVIVGSIRHENVAPLRAYYYSKDEKLMVYDYYNHGSLAALLHANRGENRIPLDWETRLRIAIGTARGIAHIHTYPNAKLVHGNIKSSNIFLNSQINPCISDLGLATLMSPTVPPIVSSVGYRAPEVSDSKRVTQMSDVYSFGVLILELLTGKSPIHATGSGDEVVHLVRWVNSVVREEWTAEVFDLELLRYQNIEEEMVEMLQIGLACTARAAERRPKMIEVVRMVEEIRPSNTGNRSSTEHSTPRNSTPPAIDT